MQLVTEAKMANSIVTKNPSHLKGERQPGTSNCSPVCYSALSITSPESQPSLGLTANGAFYSNSHHTRREGASIEEWARGAGVTYGSRTWCVSLLQDLQTVWNPLSSHSVAGIHREGSLLHQNEKMPENAIIGRLIKLVQRTLLWQKLESSLLFIYHIWRLGIPFSSWWQDETFMAPRTKLRTLPLFPPSNAYRLLSSSQGRNCFWSEAKCSLSLQA